MAWQTITREAQAFVVFSWHVVPLPRTSPTHSAAMVWPGELKSAQTKHMGKFHYFVHDKTITAPVFLPVMVHEDFKPMTFEWKSWIWQRKHTPVDCLKGVAPRLLPITDHAQPRPLLETCAMKAFWQLSRSEVEELALLKGILTSNDMCVLCFVC